MNDHRARLAAVEWLSAAFGSDSVDSTGGAGEGGGGGLDVAAAYNKVDLIPALILYHPSLSTPAAPP